jgi:hypothetical protein
MIVEDGRENGRDGRVDGSAVDYVNPVTIAVMRAMIDQSPFFAV